MSQFRPISWRGCGCGCVVDHGRRVGVVRGRQCCVVLDCSLAAASLSGRAGMGQNKTGQDREDAARAKGAGGGPRAGSFWVVCWSAPSPDPDADANADAVLALLCSAFTIRVPLVGRCFRSVRWLARTWLELVSSVWSVLSTRRLAVRDLSVRYLGRLDLVGRPSFLARALDSGRPMAPKQVGEGCVVDESRSDERGKRRRESMEGDKRERERNGGEVESILDRTRQPSRTETEETARAPRARRQNMGPRLGLEIGGHGR